MNDASLPNWKPSPELMAAFADGELDDAAELRARLEAWIRQNPQAMAELAANQKLKALFDRAAPPTPCPEAWREVLTRIENAPAPLRRIAPSGAWLIAGAAAAACILWAVLLAGNYWRTPGAPVEVFAVATDEEIEILHIEGDAIESLIVGNLPLIGDLQLAGPGEVVILNVTPDRRDNMVPVVHIEGANRPMIWARRDADGE